MISVVVPIYNEEETVKELHGRLFNVLSRQQKPFEIIFVDDGSTDNTPCLLEKLLPLTVVTLERNYGVTSAIDAGIKEANGDIIVLIDADFQNDPEDINRMLDKLSDGLCDVIVGWRKSRFDSSSRLLFSYFANVVARFMLGIAIHDFGCGLKVYRSRFIKHFRLWGEAQVFLPAVANERGAKICEMPVKHFPRVAGSSKVKISKMVRGSFDFLSVIFFVKYFSRPLRFFGGWGMVSVFLSFISFASAVWLKFAGIRDFSSTPLPVVGTLFAILGVLLIMMGFLAEILLRIYYEISRYSPYLIKSVRKNEK